ncbi:MAG: hypothetical protein A2075_07040 [Geobacteraceae bacterium GWC2_58_44]|nr:MAG: hypothetical protein A2075_07040 [Geobacteraceae bacterium GWC2_58_44]HBG04512.1 hypothetical protein [Geobacter sp.]
MKKPQIATLDEVVLARDGDFADITYRDPTVGGVNLKIGPEVARMTDQEILDCHNEVLLAMQRSVASYKHRAVEVPPGKDQVRYSEQCDQWVPRGDVLRCVIHHESGRRPVIEIDDREFTLEEFGSMLTTFSGWGMRIVFVPDTDLEKRPVIVVKDPKD